MNAMKTLGLAAAVTAALALGACGMKDDSGMGAPGSGTTSSPSTSPAPSTPPAPPADTTVPSTMSPTTPGM
ncbi:MAG: hypothetical protein ABW051_07750, partial [Burkholderiaceae bacterium]